MGGTLGGATLVVQVFIYMKLIVRFCLVINLLVSVYALLQKKVRLQVVGA